MKKLNDILLIIIFMLTAVLAAAVGFRIYSARVGAAKLEEQELAETMARNEEANERVRQVEQEIRELSSNKEELVHFIEEIQHPQPAVSEDSFTLHYVSENMTISDNIIEKEEAADDSSVSDNDTLRQESETVTGNAAGNHSVSDNVTSQGENMTLSGNSSVSDNYISQGESMTLSGNHSVSDNYISQGENTTVSDNVSISGNGISFLGDMTVSGETAASVSDGAVVSGNALGSLFEDFPFYVRPEVTLEERRLNRTSMEETLEVNQADRQCIAESDLDFSNMKIACLGDSLTAATNLESEENYQQYAYPARLKELLGAGEVYNLGIGGSTFGRYWSDPFVERYGEIPEDADVIIVMGGTNDGFCVSEKEFGNLRDYKQRTFCGDLNELMGGLREKYPDATIFFVTPLPNILQDYLMRERSYLLPQQNFVQVILTLAAAYDFEVIDLYNSNLLDSHDADIVESYVPDGVHCNHEGYQILAEHFAAEIIRHYQ